MECSQPVENTNRVGPVPTCMKQTAPTMKRVASLPFYLSKTLLAAKQRVDTERHQIAQQLKRSTLTKAEREHLLAKETSLCWQMLELRQQEDREWAIFAAAPRRRRSMAPRPWASGAYEVAALDAAARALACSWQQRPPAQDEQVEAATAREENEGGAAVHHLPASAAAGD